MIASVNYLSYICGSLNNITMLTKNIFAGNGTRPAFVNLIYLELMKRDFVSYADILALYWG